MQDDENVELHEVTLANAVVDPWTMMVVAVDALLAERAVAASRSPDHFTVRAETTGFQSVQELDEVERRVFLDDARVTEPDNDTEEQRGAK